MRRQWAAGAICVLSLYPACSDDSPAENGSPSTRGDASPDGGPRAQAAGGTKADGGRGAGGARATGGTRAHDGGAGRTTDGSLDARSQGGGGNAGAGGHATDGGLDSGSLGGRNDGGPITVPTCISTDGGGTTWPPSTPVSTAPACNPNCNAGECGAECATTETDTGFTGAACDTGCCNGNNVDRTSCGTGGPFSQIPISASAADADGTHYFVSTVPPFNGAWGLDFYETPVSGPTTVVNDLDCQSFRPTGATGEMACNDFPGYLQLAAGGPAGRTVVYLAYEIGATAEFPNPITKRARFGTRIGGQWTFEDLPFGLGQLKANSQGRAWMLSGGVPYFRNGTKGWEALPIPCRVAFTSFDLDGADALYFGGEKKEVWRRDPNGGWAMETTPGTVESLVAAGGTVHYTNVVRSTKLDGGSAATVHYGRRVGTTWSEYEVSFPLGPATYDAFLYSYNVALDACGAPHFVFSAEINAPSLYWNVTYVRWTAAGWRSTPIGVCWDPPSCGISFSASKAFIGFASGYASVPLR